MKKKRRSARALANTLLSVTLIGAGFSGCGNKLSESEIMSRLEASGLTVEKLEEPLITSREWARLGTPPETVISLRLTDGDGKSQEMTLVEFAKDFQATAAKDDGLTGFTVRNWLVVGNVSAQIQSKIASALS